jgi:ribonuclease HI
MPKEKIIIYTDGGARGNPGPAGAGVVITNAKGSVIKEAHKALGNQTNNYAEYQAVILGLETAKRIFGKEKLANYEIEIRLDSELVTSQLGGTYQVKEETLFPLWMKIWNMQVAGDVPKLHFTHIPREKNKEADRLSNRAMDENLPAQAGRKGEDITLF